VAPPRKRRGRTGFLWGAPRLPLLVLWILSLCVSALFVIVLQRARSMPASGLPGLAARVSASRLDLADRASPTQGPARVAIVIDDLGGDMEPVNRILDMDIPVTLAVLPYQRYSHTAAEEAFRRGRDVLLHVPLESSDYPGRDPGPGCLLVSMDRETIQREIQDQIASLPHCVGINPHMGALFEEHPEPLTSLIAVIKERGLVLVDNAASPRSQVSSVARSYGVTYVQRTHFLDERREESSVIRQLCSLAEFGARNGWALGIGHPYPETLAALPRAQAAFREKNVVLVPVSELVSVPLQGAETSARRFPGCGQAGPGITGPGVENEGRGEETLRVAASARPGGCFDGAPR